MDTLFINSCCRFMKWSHSWVMSFLAASAVVHWTLTINVYFEKGSLSLRKVQSFKAQVTFTSSTFSSLKAEQCQTAKTGNCYFPLSMIGSKFSPSRNTRGVLWRVSQTWFLLPSDTLCQNTNLGRFGASLRNTFLLILKEFWTCLIDPLSKKNVSAFD